MVPMTSVHHTKATLLVPSISGSSKVKWLPWVAVSSLPSKGVRSSGRLGGAWGARSVKHPTLGQVMISQFVGSNPTSGSVLTDPVSDSLSLSLSLSKINIKKLFSKYKKIIKVCEVGQAPQGPP